MAMNSRSFAEMGILSLSNNDCRSTSSLGDYLSFSSKTTIVVEYEFMHLISFPLEVKTLIKSLGWENFFVLRSRESTSYCPHVVRKFYHNLELLVPRILILCRSSSDIEYAFGLINLQRSLIFRWRRPHYE
ncbi:unnamed protein product [Linum trigynum]|uniref:Uncharacterized protein n=1 Tax=Linum trigynum TaxID=586398 RepID=A0AAV2FND3_9ROSI